VWGAVPTMAFRVLEHPSLPGRDLSAVRSISLGGAAVQPELTARLRRAFTGADRGLSTIYGMTETGGTVASASGQVMAEHPRTSGKATPVSERRIDSPQPGGEREILVRTPAQMVGYWGERRAAIIAPGGGGGSVRLRVRGASWLSARARSGAPPPPTPPAHRGGGAPPRPRARPPAPSTRPGVGGRSRPNRLRYSEGGHRPPQWACRRR